MSTQLETEPLAALARMGWNKTVELQRAGHNPANKTVFLTAVSAQLLVVINAGDSGHDLDDVDTCYAAATPEAAATVALAFATP